MVDKLDTIKNRLLGNKFGRLTIKEYIGRSDIGENLWRCLCDCGSEVIGRTNVVDKETASCRKCKYENSDLSARSKTSLLGQRFFKLTVVSYAGRNKHGAIRWNCKCDCGGVSLTRSSDLLAGKARSCGCYALERLRETNSKHGLYKHPLYSVWYAMKERCYNPNCEAYERYGGRNIRICEEWLGDFQLFYNWCMRTGYVRGLTIDRTDNDGDYEPGNCRWVTQKEQMQNNSLTKLNPESVMKIYHDPRVHSVIAKDYNVAESSVSRIKGGRTWTNITSHNKLPVDDKTIFICPIN